LWGLISVQVASPDLGIASNIGANSEARAIKWSSTYPEMEPPSVWNWSAVKKHQSRLKRVLKKWPNKLKEFFIKSIPSVVRFVKIAPLWFVSVLPYVSTGLVLSGVHFIRYKKWS
jgi:hypothetical protein